MSGTTWTKFYWSDWETDPALRLCSFAAQGLWMRMLCIASAHDPIGYVAVAGRGLDETAIARMTGGTESEVSALLGELARNGVFSRDRTGRIYSRRMVNDAKRAAIARKNGQKGGNPSLSKDRGNIARDNPADNPRLKTQEPDTRSQIPERESAPADADRRSTYPEAFEQAWKVYPHVTGRSRKPQALAAWRSLDRTDREGLSEAIGVFSRVVDTVCGGKGAPDMARWLRDKRHEAYLPQPALPATDDPPDPRILAGRFDHFAKTGEWRREWGDRPARPEAA